jgi:hypothetical protein
MSRWYNSVPSVHRKHIPAPPARIWWPKENALTLSGSSPNRPGVQITKLGPEPAPELAAEEKRQGANKPWKTASIFTPRG